ncbi:hypothetical protein [Miltoncostaea oceani]|uniref:hypothetical protein n=1 Tax=Miltoncostaea oceani TaxID=2843216 RepID=UPI001C3D17DE|nr:hypothetical protein [Miltoncostaea oceani]
MVELIVVALAVGLLVVAGASARRTALRRSRAAAEAVLDDLAAAACAHLAAGRDPSSSRRAGRAVARYERTGARVAAARSRRELDALVARHRLRTAAERMAADGLRRVRDALREGVPARR